MLESAHGADLGQLGDVPTAAQRLDQENAGIHPPPQDVDFVPLVRQSNCLRRDHLKIRIDAALVSIGEDFNSPLGLGGRLPLLPGFVLSSFEVMRVSQPNRTFQAFVRLLHERGNHRSAE